MVQKDTINKTRKMTEKEWLEITGTLPDMTERERKQIKEQIKTKNSPVNDQELKSMINEYIDGRKENWIEKIKNLMFRKK